MKVLVVHNRYASQMPSGENVSVDNEVEWLRDSGVDVALHQVTSDEILTGGRGRKLRVALEAPWSRAAARSFERQLDEVRPDLVHVHNLFPLLTASVPAIAVRRRTPVVWTARNTRMVCVAGTHFRNGQPCSACRPGWRAPGIWHGCYRASPTASALVTGSTTAFRRIARRRMATIAISEHIQRWLISSGGFDPEKVSLKYNPVADPPAGDIPAAVTSRRFLFTGRLAGYKGVELLLDAWRLIGDLDAELRIVGDGPLNDRVRAAAATDPRITWTGLLPPAAVAEQIAGARAVVVPSTWSEPFGRSAAEALAFGRPVITTGLGGLNEIIDERTGWTTGADPAALADGLTAAMSDAAVAGRSQAAIERHRRLFSPTATTRELLAIYERTLTHASAQSRAE